MDQQPETELVALLKKAALAHHKYQKRQLEGVLNQDWPAWYADYLIKNGISEWINASPSLEKLTHQLDELHKAYSSLPDGERQAIDWPGYYAPRLILLFESGDST